MKKYLFGFLLFTLSLSAQIKGVVKDSISGAPIPYVNIWVQDENIGTTSDEKGKFSVNTQENKNLIFSALGFKKKKFKSTKNIEIKLQHEDYMLEEVVIIKKLETNEIHVGNFDYSGFRVGVGNINSAIFFKPDNEMLQHPFLKQIKFLTKSHLDSAKIRIKILGLNKDSSPGESILDKEIIVSVKKGKNKNIVDFSEYKLKIPKEGFFISFEKLLIDTNKYSFEFKYKDKNGKNIIQKSITIEPELCYVPEEKDIIWQSSINGIWTKTQKQILKNPKSYENLLMRKYHDKYLMPSMLITFTN
ncbi:carboxypeptidase-like regulatory domain-containing protein [Flavobacterium sp.]|uniref:carboxypeptidase-like regulatory domain-containing protein n=1 Tax=Flavobacterium sp. TaxID=239 RepID=UPI00375017F3